MPGTNHTTVFYSLQAILVLSIMAMIVSGGIFAGIIYVHNHQAPPAAKKPSGSLGQIGSMSTESIEATYGPVNQKALHEVKEGLFARIRAARQGCAPCVPQTQSAYSYSVSRYSGTYCLPCSTTIAPSVPVVVIPKPVLEQPAPAYREPQPLKIQPSCQDGSCITIQTSVPEGYYVLSIKPSL